MEQSLIALERAMEIQLFLQIDSAYSSCIEGARIAWPVYCPKVLLATLHHYEDAPCVVKKTTNKKPEK